MQWLGSLHWESALISGELNLPDASTLIGPFALLMPGYSLVGKVFYHAAFALGAAAFFLSLLAGLGGEVATHHRPPELLLNDLAEANELYAQGKLDQAIAQYRLYVRIRPHQPVGFMNLAAAFAQIGDTAGQIDALKQAVRLNPKLGVAYYRLAEVYFQAGQYEKARSYIRLAQASRFRVPQEFLEDLRSAEKLLQNFGLGRPSGPEGEGQG